MNRRRTAHEEIRTGFGASARAILPRSDDYAAGHFELVGEAKLVCFESSVVHTDLPLMAGTTIANAQLTPSVRSSMFDHSGIDALRRHADVYPTKIASASTMGMHEITPSACQWCWRRASSGSRRASVTSFRNCCAARGNREIAFARGTSQRTIANQVHSIFDKLGVGSRRELAHHLRERASRT